MARPRICEHCGYDCTSLPDAARCPECGARRLTDAEYQSVQARLVMARCIPGWVLVLLLIAGMYGLLSLIKVFR